MSLLIAGSAQVQETDGIDMSHEIDIGCALAISSALQHLEKEPPPGKENQSFNQYVRAEFGTIACNMLDDAAHVVLLPAGSAQGGDISYTIGLDDFEVRERTFGR
jgi:hypothetical protein